MHNYISKVSLARESTMAPPDNVYFTVTSQDLNRLIQHASQSELKGITLLINRCGMRENGGISPNAEFACEVIRSTLWPRISKIKCARTLHNMRNTIEYLAKMEERIAMRRRKR